MSYKCDGVLQLAFHSFPGQTWKTDWIQQYRYDQICFFGFVDFLHPEDEATITDCSDLDRTLDQVTSLKEAKRCEFRLELNPSLVLMARRTAQLGDKQAPNR